MSRLLEYPTTALPQVLVQLELHLAAGSNGTATYRSRVISEAYAMQARMSSSVRPG
jgi:hypothetical protein